MTELFNWAATLAYFAVFLIGLITIGLITCFKEAQLALLCRQLDCIPLYDKRGYMLKAIAYSTIAICGVLGLIQAFIGV